MLFTSPNTSSSTSIDYAELIAELHRARRQRRQAVQPERQPGGLLVRRRHELVPGQRAGRRHRRRHRGRGRANASRVVWSPQGAAVHFSTNNGSSWTPSSGIPAGAVVESDRVNPLKFYGFVNGTFYVSTQRRARASRPRRPRACPLPALRPLQGRARHSKATSGSQAAPKARRTASGIPRTAGPASRGWRASRRRTTSGSAWPRRARPTPRSTRARRSAACAASSARRRGRELGRASTTTQHQYASTSARHHRRPARLRPRVRVDERPRDHPRRAGAPTPTSRCRATPNSLVVTRSERHEHDHASRAPEGSRAAWR